MTRPDYDGTRYGGQGGVIGAQQYGNRQAADQQPANQQPANQQPGGQQPGQQQYGGQQYAAQTAPPGAHAAQQYAAQATPPGAHAAPDPQQAPGQRQAPAGHPGYNSYLPPGTYRAAAAAPVIAPAAQQPAAQPAMGQARIGQAAVAQPPVAAPPVAQPVAPPPVLGGPALAQQPPAIATSTGVAASTAAPAGVAAPAAGLANEPAGLVNPVSRAAQRAAATTTSTALATGAAASRSAATAAASTPDIPHHGTVYGGRRPADGEPVFSGTLPKLHIGWHSASLSALEMIGVSSPGTGLILGADVDQRPVPVRFFRPEPTRVTLVGGVWAAQMIAFRALAFGANAVVLTGDPAAWHGFGEHATGRSDRVAVLHGERPVNTQGSAQQPMLVIHDLGVVGPTAAIDLGPWQTQLTVLRQLDERGVPALQEGQLVMMQRLAFGEATLAATALRLTGESAQLLQQMEDEMLALIGGGADRYVWISPTSVERRQGPARR